MGREHPHHNLPLHYLEGCGGDVVRPLDFPNERGKGTLTLSLPKPLPDYGASSFSRGAKLASRRFKPTPSANCTVTSWSSPDGVKLSTTPSPKTV